MPKRKKPPTDPETWALLCAAGRRTANRILREILDRELSRDKIAELERDAAAARAAPAEQALPRRTPRAKHRPRP